MENKLLIQFPLCVTYGGEMFFPGNLNQMMRNVLKRYINIHPNAHLGWIAGNKKTQHTPLSSWLVLVSYLSMICRTCSLFSGGYNTSFNLESRCLRLMKSVSWSKEMNGFLLDPLRRGERQHFKKCVVTYLAYCRNDYESSILCSRIPQLPV